jgi:hypothetical protein
VGHFIISGGCTTSIVERIVGQTLSCEVHQNWQLTEKVAPLVKYVVLLL